MIWSPRVSSKPMADCTSALIWSSARLVAGRVDRIALRVGGVGAIDDDRDREALDGAGSVISVWLVLEIS